MSKSQSKPKKTKKAADIHSKNRTLERNILSHVKSIEDAEELDDKIHEKGIFNDDDDFENWDD